MSIYPFKAIDARKLYSFHLDVDPLKERMAFATYPAVIRAKVDAALALEQLTDHLSSSSSLSAQQQLISQRRDGLVARKKETVQKLRALEVPEKDDIMTTPYIVAAYRNLIAEKGLSSLVCNEAISNCACCAQARHRPRD